jgi:hypothetical protein
MDMLENKKIREKINALDTLPETYHPNMASKWSLLEAGLDGKDNRKIIAWKRIAVAAVLVMIAGSTFVFLNYKKEDSQLSEKSPVIKPGITLTEQAPVAKVKEDLQAVKKQERKKTFLAPVKEEDKIAVIPVKDSIVQPPASENEKSMLATNTPKKKKPRFVELDFNDSVSVDKPAETWASRKIKFRTGADKLSYHEANGEITIGIPLF